MKFYTIVMTGLVLVGSASFAAANPAMLPKHPGYPSGGEYANDTGQKNLTVEQSLSSAAASEDAHTGQKLVDPNNARLLKPQGAGPLPTVEGPNIKIEPPVTEATRMPKQCALFAPEGMALLWPILSRIWGGLGERTGLSQGAGLGHSDA